MTRNAGTRKRTRVGELLVTGVLSVAGVLGGCGTPGAAPGSQRPAGSAPYGSRALHHTRRAAGDVARTVDRGAGHLNPARRGSAARRLLGLETGRPAGMGTMRHLPVIAFWMEPPGTGPRPVPALQALGAQARAVDELSPLWYRANADGTLQDMSNPVTARFAHRHGLALVPLVTNGTTGDRVLLSPASRDRLVTSIADVVEKHGYRGVNVDFQNLTDTARVPLVTFVDELSHRLHPLGKTVAVSIIPSRQQTSDHGAYDEPGLARYADRLVLMTYDHHSVSSPPGPVSPTHWVVAAVRHALRAGVPPQKIVLGVNAYGYDWNTTRGTASTLALKDAHRFPRATKHYDARAHEMRMTYTAPSGRHVAWYSNEGSLMNKLHIARRFHLGGIAIWRVGYETPAFWRTLRAANGVRGRGPTMQTMRTAPTGYRPGPYARPFGPGYGTGPTGPNLGPGAPGSVYRPGTPLPPVAPGYPMASRTRPLPS